MFNWWLFIYIIQLAKKSNRKSSLGIAVYVIQSSLLKIITIMPGFMAGILFIDMITDFWIIKVI